MRAMVLERAGEPLRMSRAAGPGARARAGPDPRPRLRRLPHRPPHPRRRAGRAEAAAGPGPPDRRHGDWARGGSGALRARRPGRRALARLDRRRCRYCRGGRENLCDNARFSGYDIDGGYAELAVADERFCFPIPVVCVGRASGAAALRRADRIPGAAPGRRRPSGSASTASAPPPTSSARSRSTKAAASSPSPARATRRRRRSPAGSAPSGPAPRARRRRRSSTARSSSPPPAS